MTYVGGVAAEQLKSILQRIERLEEEKSALSSDLKEVYAEAKSQGYDGPTLRKVVQLRKMDVNKRLEQEELLDLYLAAVGMSLTKDEPRPAAAEADLALADSSSSF